MLVANGFGHIIFVLSNSNEEPGLPILKNQFETVFRPKKTLKFKFSEKPLTNLGGFFVSKLLPGYSPGGKQLIIYSLEILVF